MGFKMLNKIINNEKRWSPLIQLNIEHLDDCLKLENRMIERMKNKPHTFDYIRKRSEDEFKVMLTNREIFGTFLDERLIGISVVEKYTDVFDTIKYTDGNLCIPEKLKVGLENYNGSCWSCLMTDLDPKNVGVGGYIATELQDICKDRLGIDYLICDIHVKHPSSYRVFTEKYLGLGCSHKVLNIENMNGEIVRVPKFFLISILNENFSKNIKSNLNICVDENFKYTDDMATNIINNDNKNGDVILKKNEILLLDGRKISKFILD